MSPASATPLTTVTVSETAGATVAVLPDDTEVTVYETETTRVVGSADVGAQGPQGERGPAAPAGASGVAVGTYEMIGVGGLTVTNQPGVLIAASAVHSNAGVFYPGFLIPNGGGRIIATALWTPPQGWNSAKCEMLLVNTSAVPAAPTRDLRLGLMIALAGAGGNVTGAAESGAALTHAMATAQNTQALVRVGGDIPCATDPKTRVLMAYRDAAAAADTFGANLYLLGLLMTRLS